MSERITQDNQETENKEETKNPQVSPDKSDKPASPKEATQETSKRKSTGSNKNQNKAKDEPVGTLFNDSFKPDNAQNQLSADAKKTQERLAKQPKIRFMIPLQPNEKEGAFETVQINGYRLVIKKNVFVDLPEQVVDILSEHYRISSEVGKEYRTDRDQKTQDALTA